MEQRVSIITLGVADLARGSCEQRHVLTQQCVVLDVVVAGEAADGDGVAVVAHAFVDAEETGMVNAVLDQLARQLRAGEFAGAR